MKVAFTGASGFVGSHLRKKFTEYVIILRNDNEENILKKLDGVDVVINLAGAPIIKRWSESYKKVMVDSRVQTTKKLVNAINKSEVKHFISAFAIGAYPDNTPLDESYTGYGDDFLASLTKMWEAEANKSVKPTTILRFGMILSNDGGALAQMLLPFKMGIGGVIGDGKMINSWIDIQDLVRIYEYVIENSITGVLNVTAPNPVTNYEFTKALGKALNRPTFFPLPEFVLKLIFGEGSTVITGSKEIYPKVLDSLGFKFEYETIEKSLEHLLS